MKIFNNRKVSINYLQYLNIADKNGVIDYKKFTEYKKKELEKGYNIYLDKKDFKYKSDIDLIDWDTNKGDKTWINLNKNF